MKMIYHFAKKFLLKLINIKLKGFDVMLTKRLNFIIKLVSLQLSDSKKTVCITDIDLTFVKKQDYYF